MDHAEARGPSPWRLLKRGLTRSKLNEAVRPARPTDRRDVATSASTRPRNRDTQPEVSLSGQVIALEGPDDSGKTTLATSLLRHLRSQGLDCLQLSFHGAAPGPLGGRAQGIHDDSTPEREMPIPAISLHLRQLAARVELIDSAIRPAVQSGKTVILDGYYWSTWVRGLASGIPLPTLHLLKRLEDAQWTDMSPVFIFLLDRSAPGNVAPSSQAAAERAAYRDLALRKTRGARTRVIDNNRSPYDAITDVYGFLLPQVRKRTRRRPESLQVQLPFKDASPPMAFVPVIRAAFAAAKPTIVYDTYWRFAAERQQIFFRRFRGESPPWSADPIFRQYKFTNAYRASDRVSQYLIRNVIYDGEQSFREVFFRTVLFKFFNRIQTWELLCRSLGTMSFTDYSYDRYEAVFASAIANDQTIYSAAYIMPSGGRGSEYKKKHQMHLKLLERMMSEHLPERIADARTMRDAFGLLRGYPTIGDFLAYQYITDLNYSASLDFDEMEFVMPGPGALDGIRKCFPDIGSLSESDLIRLVTEHQNDEFLARGIAFRSLWGRPLQLIDCQNLFCEVDKYSRVKHPTIQGVSGRANIKQRYAPHGEIRKAWYPPKWGLNEMITGAEVPGQRDNTPRRSHELP